MLTGEIRNQIDAIWNAFWSGGISNPLEVIEQITYLLFLRRLDEMQELEDNETRRLGKTGDCPPIYPKGKDSKGLSFDQLRWSRFKNEEARRIFDVVSEHVFPFLRSLGGGGSPRRGASRDRFARSGLISAGGSFCSPIASARHAPRAGACPASARCNGPRSTASL